MLLYIVGRSHVVPGWMTCLICWLTSCMCEGLGAGVVMMPALTILFRLHKDDCRAITLAILCAPSTLGAVIGYSIKGDVKWGIAIVMFFGYLIFNKLGESGTLILMANQT